MKFSFTQENIIKANASIAKYPAGKQKSAVLALLDLAQRQNNGHLSVEAIEYVADYLAEPYMRVYEVASFYTMFNLKPVGRYHIQVCGTTPCYLRGAKEIMKACEQQLEIKCGDTTKDGQFTLTEVECLGACVNAPLAQINDQNYEDLNSQKICAIIDELRNKK